MADWIRAIGRMIRGQPQIAPQTWAWVDRNLRYLAWDAYYSNTIYEDITDGGQRQNINAVLGNAAAADLAGLYNPVGAVCDLYLNVFGGSFGEQIQVIPDGNADARLTDAIATIWRWTNMSIEKQPLCRLAAIHGTTGIRIVAKDTPGRQRVYLKVEHPKIIRDKEEDDRGNITAIQLEYEETTGLAEKAVVKTIREELTKTEFVIYEVNGTQLTERSRQPNGLGVVPYVVVHHDYLGEDWGRNAFYRARSPIDRINALITHINVQIHRHVRVKWFMAASGAPPKEIDLSDMTVAYVDTSKGGTGSTGQPYLQAMVADLNLADSIAEAKLLIEVIEDMLPELKATQGKFLAGQSGETIAQLRKPASDRILLARTNYEDAMIRAQQIAVSLGVYMRLWDVGSGMGPEAAQTAYTDGWEDHHFNERPAFQEENKPATSQASTPAAEPGTEGDPFSTDGEGKPGQNGQRIERVPEEAAA